MTLSFILALAQAAPAQSLGPSGTTVLFEGVAIMAIFYFLLIRPQSKERKQVETAIMALKRGDEILTAGGIIGEVVFIQMQVASEGKEAAPSLADRVTIKSGESKLIVERGRITRVTPKG
jgi:preprotein translocase subunit YajC